MPESFVLKTEKFEGPLSVLLNLIKDRKLHISEVSLASIADEYVAHIKSREMKESDLTEFLGILSTLLLIKARSLFPEIKLTDSQEEEIDELEEHLKRFELVSEGAKRVRKMLDGLGLVGVRGIKRARAHISPYARISLERLQAAALAVSIRIPKISETYTRVNVEKKIRMETIVADIMNHFSRTFSSTFGALAEAAQTRQEKVLHFLALLELVKSGMLTATQPDTFHEIRIERHSVDLPRYGS